MQPETAPYVAIHRGDAPLVRLANEYALPERFGATITPAEPDIPVCHLVVAVENGRAICDGLQLERRPGGLPFSGTMLRRIPLAEYLRQAVDEAGYAVFSTTDPSAGITITWDDGERFPIKTEPIDGQHVAASIGGMTYTADYKSAAREPRVGLLNDETLDEVADVYRRAHARHQPPTRAVMDEWHVSRSTASRWIRRAREAGRLGAARPRVAGELGSSR